jgi:putative endonuclease
MEKYFVYILKGKRYYVWYTLDVEKRLLEHRRWTSKTTRELWDWVIVKVIECKSKTDAIKLERKIKRWGHVERWVN